MLNLFLFKASVQFFSSTFIFSDNFSDLPTASTKEKTNFAWTLESVMGTGGTFHGHDTRPPGSRVKSNWQQILGSGPHVWGTS